MLDQVERDLVASLVDGAKGTTDFVQLALSAQQLPQRVRHAMAEFRLSGRPWGGFVLSGLPVDESRLESTPDSYAERPCDPYTAWVETMLLLVGSALGDPISFATQQRGRLVLDVFPLRGHEKRQLGTSSDVLLEWHNEDAFLDLRPDWILLLGLRNHDHTPTTVGFAHELALPEPERELLFEERFVLLPDDSHTAALNDEIAGVDAQYQADAAFDEIAGMATQPRRVAILSGDPQAPFIQIDPAFMEFSLDDPPAEAALARVIEEMTAGLHEITLLPGDLLILDNKRAVHGRRPFQARFDGTDRWLKRILLTADLRRTTGMRGGAHGRAIHVRNF